VRTRIKLENHGMGEYGYGLYVNAYVIDGNSPMGLWASECLPRDASEDDIRAASRRVRSRALYHYRKEFYS